MSLHGAAGARAKGLGRALGYLVGALVLGTAFPHLIRALGTQLPVARRGLSYRGRFPIVGGFGVYVIAVTNDQRYHCFHTSLTSSLDS